MTKALEFQQKFCWEAVGLWALCSCLPQACSTEQSRSEQVERIMTFLCSFALNDSTGEVIQILICFFF